MQIGSILAFVDGGMGSEKVIRAAIAVGNSFSAYVEVLHIERPAGPVIAVVAEGGSAVSSAALIESMEREEEARSKAAKGLFQELCINTGQPIVEAGSVDGTGEGNAGFAWNLVSGNDSRELAYRGRMFDLIILAKADEQEGGIDSAQLEAALFDTGRPVLIASDMSLNLENSRVAIAWDGSREAARSVGLGLPFLKAAEEVSIISIDEEGDSRGAEDLSRYLLRHGVKNECCSVKANGSSIARSLIEEIRDHNVNLLVMGAYGHSVLKEYLFGGVTRELLEAGDLPLLLSH